MRTYKIYLLRHGLTEANDNGRYIGRTDLPLSPSGFAHILDMKQTYVYPEAAHFYTSPLLRCRQTLSVLYPGCQPRVIPGLAECDFGEWEGRAVSELKYDEAFQQWVEGTSTVIPGGEDTASFQKRVTEGFNQIVQDVMRAGDGDAVVCTHGGIIMLLMALYGLPELPMREWLTSDGAGFALRVTPSVWMREPKAEALCAIPWEKE